MLASLPQLSRRMGECLLRILAQGNSGGILFEEHSVRIVSDEYSA